MAAINKWLVPLGVELPQMDREVVGGYFVWLTLPRPLKGALVAERAKEDENLIVAQGEMFEVPGDTEHAHFERDLRICFAWEDEAMLAEGIERLGSVIRAMQNEGEGDGDKTANGGKQGDQTTTGESAKVKDFW